MDITEEQEYQFENLSALNDYHDDDGNHDHSEVRGGQPQSSPKSVIEDTQFDDLELDTQVDQESLVSHVPETQYEDLEADTQAVDDSVVEPATQAPRENVLTQHAANAPHVALPSLLKRPELSSLEDAGNGFRFIAAKPRTQNPSKRPPPRPSNVFTDANDLSGPGSTNTVNTVTQEAEQPKTRLHPMTTQLPPASAEKPNNSHPNVSFGRRGSQITRPETASCNDTAADPSEDTVHEFRSTHHATGHPQSKHAITTQAAGAAIHPPQIVAEISSGQPRAAQPQALATMTPVPTMSQNEVNVSKQSKVLETAATTLPQTGPLTPLKSAQNARSLRRKLSSGRQRIKQPFPEATTSEESRRWRDKTPATSRATESTSDIVETRSGTPSNTGRTRLPARDEDKSNDIEVRCHHQSFSAAGNSHVETSELLDVGDEVQANHVAFQNGETHSLIPCPSNAQWGMENGTDAPNRASSRLRDNAVKSVHQDLSIALSDDLRSVAGHFPARPSSRAMSQAQSRPQSRHSDRHKPVSRPLSSHNLKSAESTMLHVNHASKVKKTTKSTKQNGTVDRPKSPALPSVDGVPSMMQKFRSAGDDILKTLFQLENDIESQKVKLLEREATIESQKADLAKQGTRIQSQNVELQQLRTTNQEVETLRERNTLLTESQTKLFEQHRKLKEQASKYANHANEVVKAQKWLKDEAEKIRAKTDHAMAVWKHHEQATVKLEGALKDSKELRLAVQNFDEVSKQKQDLITVNSKLLADKELCEQNLKALETQLQEAKLQHSNEQASLAAEIADLHADAKQNLKSYQLLQNELNERLTELQREKHNSEKLLKNLDEQTAKWGQLLELAKQIPKDTAEVLNGEDGKLATILSSKNTTQEKIEEMTSMIEELVNCERELPPTLVKLVEDVALRLEGEKQLSDGNGNILRDTAATISQELQEGLNQLRLDKEAEIRLKSKIAELEQVRESLNADKSARDTEVDNLLRQLNETERELSSCRSDLSNKTNELTVALNAPRDDPVLQSKISELEKINNLLDDETKKMSQELSKAKEELSSIRKTAANKEEEKNVLAQTLISAQQTIKNFEQEMAKTLALKDEEHKKKYQDLARNGESQKATIKMKLEAEVKTLESRVTERNTEIDSLKEQLQRLPSEANQRTADLEAEVASYKEQILQLIPQLKRLEQDKPSNWDSVGFSGELRSAQNELADLRLLFQSATTETTRILEVATKEQRAIEDALRRFDESQKKISAGAASQSLEQPNLNARDGISRSDRRLDSSSIMLSSSRISGPKHTKFASTEDDAGEKFWTPTLLPRGPVERLGGASIHSVQQQNHALDSHALRVAPRKNNWIESSTRFANKPDINTLQPPGKNHDSDMLQVTADRTPISYESSPLSDLSSMFDDFGSTNDQVEVHKEYETRSKRDNGLAAPRSAFAQQTVLDLTQQSSSIGEIQGSNHQPTHSVMAKANALSHAEESHRRRNAQLPKSALKKPIRSSDILPQPSMASEGRGDSARETGFRNNKTMGPPQRTDRPLVNFKGVVSGNSARSMTSVGRESSSALTYGTSDASHFFDLQHSPPMDAPKRNRSKRLASARLESDKTKVSRISFPSRLSSQSVIADSQADSQDSEYN